MLCAAGLSHAPGAAFRAGAMSRLLSCTGQWACMRTCRKQLCVAAFAFLFQAGSPPVWNRHVLSTGFSARVFRQAKTGI